MARALAIALNNSFTTTRTQVDTLQAEIDGERDADKVMAITMTLLTFGFVAFNVVKATGLKVSYIEIALNTAALF